MKLNRNLTTNITKAKELKPFIFLTAAQEAEMEKVLEQFPMAIPKYYFSLINWDNPQDPIRRMCIPSTEENDMTGTFDTSGEADNTTLPGLQHKYRETALILSTHRCAMYCRHCFRKRMVGITEDETVGNFVNMVEYIRAHPEINNVLISGGDAFLNSNQVIEQYLNLLSDIKHLDLIRFGTRTPVVLPARIYDDLQLLESLKTHNRKKQIYVVTQFNHPNELTPEARKAVDALLNCGVIVKNQTVLLKGVNDNADTLAALLQRLTHIGVIPYYIFQCRPVSGVGSHFQVPLAEGCRLVAAAKEQQNGQGKCIRFVMSHITGKIEIFGENTDGEMIFRYHQAKYERDKGRIFSQTLADGQTWLTF